MQLSKQQAGVGEEEPVDKRREERRARLRRRARELVEQSLAAPDPLPTIDELPRLDRIRRRAAAKIIVHQQLAAHLGPPARANFFKRFALLPEEQRDAVWREVVDICEDFCWDYYLAPEQWPGKEGVGTVVQAKAALEKASDAVLKLHDGMADRVVHRLARAAKTGSETGRFTVLERQLRRLAQAYGSDKNPDWPTEGWQGALALLLTDCIQLLAFAEDAEKAAAARRRQGPGRRNSPQEEAIANAAATLRDLWWRLVKAGHRAPLPGHGNVAELQSATACDILARELLRPFLREKHHNFNFRDRFRYRENKQRLAGIEEPPQGK